MVLSRVLIPFLVLAAGAAAYANDFSADRYQLVIGDFDGDNADEMFALPRQSGDVCGVVDSSLGETLDTLTQTWPSNDCAFTGLAGNQFTAYAGDFNTTFGTDLLLFRASSSNSYVIESVPASGGLTGVDQTIASGAFGFSADANSHVIIPGDYDDSGISDLLLQADASSGTHGMVLAGGSGQLGTAASTWVDADDYAGVRWSGDRAKLYAADFNGDGHDDVLVQPFPTVLMLAGDVDTPIVRYEDVVILAGNAGGTFTLLDTIDVVAASFNWSAKHYDLVLGDFDGDGDIDVFAQSLRAGADSYLVLGDNGNAGSLATGTVLPIADNANGTVWSGERYRLLAGNFSGTGQATLYKQAASGADENEVVTFTSAGAIASVDANDLGAASIPGEATAVGRTAGEFSVDMFGAANYSIPLVVPPGVAGMAPQLSLSYSNRSGNGLMGIGFSLGGLSAISRCGTLATTEGAGEGEGYGVTLDATDRYCLDGSRLIATSGQYGANGTEYRTEMASFRRVTSYGGNPANGPAYFKVEDKAGLIYYYGSDGAGGDEGYINAGTSALAMTYAVARIEDRFGNFIKVDYTENNTIGEYYPTVISYGGQGTGSSDQIVAEVRFNYGDRSDDASGYLAGYKISTTQRLESIVTGSTASPGGTMEPVREYLLAYSHNAVSGISELRTVQECSKTVANFCKPPTRFRWEENARGFTLEQDTGIGSTSLTNLRLADVNADGRIDFLYTSGGRWKVKTSGLSADAPGQGPVVKRARYALTMDFDGDGVTDILQSSGNSAECEVAYGSTGGLSASIRQSGMICSMLSQDSEKTVAVDVNSDGLQDLIYANEGLGVVEVYRNLQGAGFESIADIATADFTIQTIDGQKLRVLDWDGDGRAEVMSFINNCPGAPGGGGGGGGGGDPGDIQQHGPGARQEGSIGGRVPGPQNGQTCHRQLRIFGETDGDFDLEYYSTPNVDFPDIEHARVIDVNGDGLGDFMGVVANRWRVWTSTGVDFIEQVLPATVQLTGQTDNVDWNWFEEGECQIDAQCFDEADWIDPEDPFTVNVSLTKDRFEDAKLLDYDHDGRTDIMIHYDGRWYVLRSDGVSYETRISDSVIIASASTLASAMLVDTSGDGLTDLYYPKSGNWRFRHMAGPRPGLLTEVKDGFESRTQIAYSYLTDSTVYKGHTPMPSGSSVAFPYQNLMAPVPVVAKFSADNGLGDAANPDVVYTMYEYRGAKVHAQGRGMLGFSEIKTWNDNTGKETVTTYAQAFPFTGMTKATEERVANAADYDSRLVDPSPSPDLNEIYDQICETSPVDCDTIRPPGFDGAQPLNGQNSPPTLVKVVNVFGQDQVDGVATFAFVDTSTQEQWAYINGGIAPGAAPFRRTVTDFDYVGRGNSSRVAVTVDDGVDGNGDEHTVTTVNAYSDDAANWCLGRLTSATVTHEQPADTTSNTGATLVTRESSFTYDPQACVLKTETVEPQSAALKTVTTYDYDDWGNVRQTTVADGGSAVPALQRFYSRVTATTYTADGRFIETRTSKLEDPTLSGLDNNGLEHTSIEAWDHKYGVQTSLTDVNGNQLVTQYDGFGRKTREFDPASSVASEWIREWCGGWTDCLLEGVYTVREQFSTGAESLAQFDRLGREVLTRIIGWDGEYRYEATRFDPLGRPFLESDLFLFGGEICWTWHLYDALDRVIENRSPDVDQSCSAQPGDGRLTDIAYGVHPLGSANWRRTQTTFQDAFTTVSIDPNGRTVFRAVDIADRLIELSEQVAFEAEAPQTTRTRYGYDAQGNMTWVQDAEGHESHVVINKLGHKVSMDDPDMGEWFYVHNALGELVQQTDAKGQITTQAFDDLGRMVERVEPRTGGGTDTTRWEYDSASNGTGLIARVVGPYNSVGNPAATDPEVAYSYDTHSMLALKRHKIDGSWYEVETSYDSYLRLHTTSYPNVNLGAEGVRRLRVRQDYNANGFNDRTIDADTGKVYWEVEGVDVVGSFSQVRLGNGLQEVRAFDRSTRVLKAITTGGGAVQELTYTWDSANNLLGRADANTGQSESFAYDSLYRLRRSTYTDNVTVDIDYTYDLIGNIKSKGTGYSNYLYQSSRPHAVTDVSATDGLRQYFYDANGNIESRQGASITWTSFNKPERIDAPSGSYSLFTYNADRMRITHRAVDGANDSTITYVDSLYERIDDGGTVEEHRMFVRAGGRVISTVTWWGNGNEQTRYLHRDHLNSVDVMTDESGVVVDRFAFDPWGKRRPAANWGAVPSPGSYLTASFHRGFTGHEHLDHLGLVHMNGRIYDPEIGRFLSADLFVQFPESTQGFNRYSYVGNNPLSYSDPSGYKIFGIIAGIVSAATGVGLGLSIAYSALASVVDGLVAGQSFAQALLGGAFSAASAGIFAGIGSGFEEIVGASVRVGVKAAKVLSHGLAGGLLSAARGGRFLDGLIGSVAGATTSALTGGGLAQAASRGIGEIAREVTIASVISGTASALSGGKFASGARSGAFGQLFNHLKHRAQVEITKLKGRVQQWELIGTQELTVAANVDKIGDLLDHAESTANAACDMIRRCNPPPLPDKKAVGIIAWTALEKNRVYALYQNVEYTQVFYRFEDGHTQIVLSDARRLNQFKEVGAGLELMMTDGERHTPFTTDHITANDPGRWRDFGVSHVPAKTVPGEMFHDPESDLPRY
ncbi:MAG: FG-GAP-like repeat-containing protein [Pseudomonadota bacterium]